MVTGDGRVLDSAIETLPGSIPPTRVGTTALATNDLVKDDPAARTRVTVFHIIALAAIQHVLEILATRSAAPGIAGHEAAIPPLWTGIEMVAAAHREA